MWNMWGRTAAWKKRRRNCRRPQVDLVDFAVGPAGNVEQVVFGVQGGRVVAVSRKFDLAEAPVVLEVDDMQARVVVIGNVQLVPFFIVTDADRFGQPGQGTTTSWPPCGR